LAATNNTPGDDERLSAYIDGELTPAERLEVEKRLRDSAEIRSECESLASVAELTTAGLRAARCLTPADRAAYLHDSLPPERRTEVEEHLARCRNCQNELDELRRWAAEQLTESEADADASPAQGGQPRPAESPARRSLFTRWAGVFMPLAAAAAMVIGVTTMLLDSAAPPPELKGLNIQAAVVRSAEDNAGGDISFGSAHPLHTNDSIQFRLAPGPHRYASIFWMYPDGSVYEQKEGPLDDLKYLAPEVTRRGAVATVTGSVVLPRWRLPAYVGTDVILIVMTKEPLADDAIARVKNSIASAGPPPELSYGSILWLGRDARWTPKPPARLNELSATVQKALGAVDSAVCGVAFAHE